MPTIQEQRNYDAILSQNKVLQMDKGIIALMPEAGPLVTATMKASKKPVHAPVFYHMEQEPFPRWITFLNAETASATTPDISATEATYLDALLASHVYVVVHVPRTGENMTIKSTDADANLTKGDLTAVRGTGGTTAAALLAGDKGYILDTVGIEGGEAPDPSMVLEVVKTFYTQTFRNASEVTWDAAATELYGGPDRPWQNKMIMLKTKIDMELALTLGGTGARTDHDSVTKYYGYATGINGTITSHVRNINGVFTESDLWGLLDDCSENHYGDYLLLGSPRRMKEINFWALNKIQTSSVAEKYGVNLKQITCADYIIHLAKENLWRGTHLDGLAFLIPMPIEDVLKYRPLSGNGKNYDVALYPNIKTENNVTLYKDEVMAKVGFQLYEEAKWGKITDVP